jgi:3-hydroxyisobutyrate dehydrogenase
MKIGIVGVGLMGHGIASNLLKHGHSLRLMNHPGNQPVDDLLAAGAEAVDSGADVARFADVVIVCVTGAPEVKDVLFREDGVVAGLGRGEIIIDCSTSLPGVTREIAEQVADRGGHFIDAAMTRTPKEAAEGRLNLIVGAPSGLFERVLPLLRCFAENVTHAGDVGAGHQLKLIHNFVSLGFTGVLAEAAAGARSAGIAPEAFIDVVASGGGGGVVFERLRPFIQSDDPSGFRFTIANALKDLTYYVNMAEETGAACDAAAAIQSLYHAAEAGGHGARTVPELIAILDRQGG